MKFAALALTLLLAVGSEAAAMQADAPSESDRYRMVTDAIKRSLTPLEGTKYSYVKNGTEWMFDLLGPYVATTSESFDFDYEGIVGKLRPLFDQFRIREHIDQYIEKLGPILTHISADYRAATDSIIPKIQPGLMELKPIFRENVKETTKTIISILAVIFQEATKVAEMAQPYVKEYKEYLTAAVPRSENDWATKCKEASPMAQEMMENFIKMMESGSLGGN